MCLGLGSRLFSRLLISKDICTWYCYYRRRDDKGVDFEVGDVWHERPVRPGAVAAVQAGDEVAVAGLKQISSNF